MKKDIILIILGFVFIGLGSGLFLIEIADYEYVDSLPDTVEKSTKTFEYNIDKKIYIANSGTFDIVVSEDVTPGKAKVQATYYTEANLFKVSRNDFSNSTHIHYYISGTVKSTKYYYDFVVDMLRDKKVYDISEFGNIDVVLFVNPKDEARFNKLNNINDKFYLRDETEECAEMLEEIATDDNYTYYLPCLQSETIFVIYNDGYKESIRAALNKKNVTIYELLNNGLEVIKEAK